MSDKRYLGIDTSNYTTSVGVLSDDGEVQNLKRLLPVPDGMCGLRQSDALFHHIRQFPSVFDSARTDGVVAVGVSARPRSVEGSYMPCFLAGTSIAESIGHVLHVPVYSFSHQQGHIAAGLLSCGHPEFLSEPFYAFHLSGGTLELVLADGIDNIKIVAKTLDLTAGQLIDRIGVRAGVPFPAGAKLDCLSLSGKLPKKSRISLKNGNCCLSGFENQAIDLLKKGTDVADVALFLFDTVGRTVSEMVKAARETYGNYPCLYVGGVMANSTIRAVLSQQNGAYFADPALSSDNAVGIAMLTKLRYNGDTV